MIIIDTNVLSEMMRPSPSTKVLKWLNEQNTSFLYITSITLGEIEYGLQILPDGNRRQALQTRFDEFVTKAFKSRTLKHGPEAARIYGSIMAHQRSLGRPMSIADGQIAAITKVNNFNLATRNTKDFKDCGIDLINPFD